MTLLDGKLALITGGTTGLGKAIAARFIREGARVVITGRDEAIGATTQADLGPPAQFLVADAADPEAIVDSVARSVAWLGGLDVLVNNAGRGVAGRLTQTPLADYDRLMAVNVRGPFLYAKAALPHLEARGGSIIHTSSDAAHLGETEIGLYSVSKAALEMLSKMLAVELGPKGVRSNCIAPGDIRPGMRHMAPPGEESGQEEEEGWTIPPIGRIGEAEDVAAAAVYLASADASFVTGATILVDGGMRAGYNTGTKPE